MSVSLMKNRAAICTLSTLVLTAGLAQSSDDVTGRRAPHAPEHERRCEAAAAPRAGVNLAGADFGGGNLPGTYGQDYTYPSAADVDLFLARQVRLFRVPFLWERLQRSAYGKFDAE